MRTYSLVRKGYEVPRRRYRYVESDAKYEARSAINELKLRKFKINWDVIQREMGVDIPYEERLRYQNAYAERSFSVAEMLKNIEGTVASVGFLSTLISGLLKLYVLNHILFIVAVCAVVILMLSRAIHSSSHKLGSLDPAVIDKIVNQMRSGGFNAEEIKNVWGESYQAVNDGYIDSPWRTFFINALGMAGMSFIMSMGLTGIVNMY